jgi:hypothetical protein
MQADDKLHNMEMNKIIKAFGHDIAQLVLARCQAAMEALNEKLYGIRDGVVADEAAVKRMKARKYDPKQQLNPILMPRLAIACSY